MKKQLTNIEKKIKKDKNKQQELEEICSLKMMPLENYAEVNEAHT